MSNEAQAWAFRQPIPPAPKLVLLALANNANKQGKQCFPSLKLIVENCTPMKVRTVQYHLKWLAEEAKLITITPWYHPSGRQTSNLYELSLDTTYCGEGARSCTPPDVQIAGGRVQEVAGGRVQEVAGGRVQEVAGGRVQEVAPLLNPESLDLKKKEESPGGAASTRRRMTRVCDTGEVWEVYRLGYARLYGLEPVRDATTNTVLKRLVQKFGNSEAPAIVRHYLQSQRSVYVESRHPPTLLLRDCYGLRTDMKQGPRLVKPVTSKAMQLVPSMPRGEPCPPEVQERLSRLLGRKASSFSTAAVRDLV